MAPKQAARAAVNHGGGADGSGVKANVHHKSVDATQSTTTKAGSFGGRIRYPTFQRNDRIFQFAK